MHTNEQKSVGVAPLNMVLNHLERQGGEDQEHDISYWDLKHRARFIDDPDHPELVVFEMERRQPILGEVYPKGLEMYAFITLTVRYGFDPVADRILKLGDSGDADIQYDWGELAAHNTEVLDFKCVVLKEGGCLIWETCCRAKATIRSREEAVSFGRGIVDWSFDPLGIELEASMEAAQIQQILAEIKELCTVNAERLAVMAWEDRADEGLTHPSRPMFR